MTLLKESNNTTLLKGEQKDGAYLQVADVCGLHGPMKHYLQEEAGDLFISPPRTSLQLKNFSKLAQQVTLQVSYSNPLCFTRLCSQLLCFTTTVSQVFFFLRTLI